MAKKTIKAENNNNITRVRQLAWTGQHAAAIDSATQALAAPKIKPAGGFVCSERTLWKSS